MKLGLVISPLAKGAFFANYVSICQSEVLCILGCRAKHALYGKLDLLECELEPEALPTAARLSFFQGAFEIQGQFLRPWI